MGQYLEHLGVHILLYFSKRWEKKKKEWLNLNTKLLHNQTEFPYSVPNTPPLIPSLERNKEQKSRFCVFLHGFGI